MKQTITKDNGTTHTLINSDCLDVCTYDLPECNLILTDLPYFKVKNLPWDKSWNNKKGFLSWVSLCTEKYKECLTENGRFIYFSTQKFSHNIGTVLENAGLYVSTNSVWKKPDAAGAEKGVKGCTTTRPVDVSERYTVAEFENPLGAAINTVKKKPASTICHEIFGKKTGIVSLWLAPKDSWGSCTPRCKDWIAAMESCGVAVTDADYYKLKHVYNNNNGVDYDVYEAPYVTRKGKHPCEKPLDLLRSLVRTYTNKGDTVLDFTAGSMSLAVACYLEGRNSICIEMDEVQYSKSVDWVKNCTEDNPYNNYKYLTEEN